ncbi:MAG: hypothetical protein ACYTGH_10205 [Planctomycetota bacterium]|jgi:hypothetical protein
MPATKTFHAEIVELNGAPALTVNGRPVFLNAPYLAKAPYESFVESSPEVYLVYDHALVVNEDGTPDITKASDPKDQSIKEQIDALLSKDPNALVIVRSFPPAPLWWLDQHPAEEVQYDVDLNAYEDHGMTRDASWGSDLWLQAVVGWYEALCRDLHERYGGRVIGHQFGMGTCGENNPQGACAKDGRWFCSDFSPAMHRYFRQWLKARYGSDDALRKGWNDPGLTLKTALVPTRIQRLQSDWFTFRDPRKAQVADYYLAFSERVEQIVISICEGIKQATEGHCIAGSHLGAFMDNGYHGYIYHQTSINSVKNALKHPAVDIFTSPSSYVNKGPGGVANSMMPTGSYTLHNKLIFQDQDSRTCLISSESRKGYTRERVASDMPETVGILKRDVGQAIIGGYGLWWHAIVPGIYDHPDISACISKLNTIGKQSLHFPRGTADGVAMIVDEESVFHQQCANRLIFPMLYYQRQHFWNQSGVPWNSYLHNDLAHPDMPDHKLYYFLNTFYLTDEEIQAIEKKVKGSGATVIWTVAPGIQSPDGLSLERAERLTGFRLKAAEVEALPRISFTNFDHPYVRYQPSGVADRYARGAEQPNFFGTGPMGNDERERAIGPLIHVDDPEATVLGELDVLQRPGFCVKEMDGWTSVFCSAPMLNNHVLQNIARAAGVHVYSESDDVVVPGKSFLMLHAREAGEKQIRLPAPADVYECYDGRLIGRQVTEFSDTLEQHATGLYFMGDVDDYLRGSP